MMCDSMDDFDVFDKDDGECDCLYCGGSVSLDTITINGRVCEACRKA